MNKKLPKSWWIFIVVLSLMFLRMVASFFIGEDIYVGLPVFIGLMVAILFLIFAIFKWGKTEQ